jgi:hypothetical protein
VQWWRSCQSIVIEDEWYVPSPRTHYRRSSTNRYRYMFRTFSFEWYPHAMIALPFWTQPFYSYRKCDLNSTIKIMQLITINLICHGRFLKTLVIITRIHLYIALFNFVPSTHRKSFVFVKKSVCRALCVATIAVTEKLVWMNINLFQIFFEVKVWYQ